VAVPDPVTWTAIKILVAFMNTNIRDVFNFLLSPPRAKTHRTAAKSTANATWVLYDMDAEEYDPYSPAMHDNATNNSRVVAPEAYLYRVEMQVTWANTSGGTREFEVRKNAAGSQAGGTLLLGRTQDSTGGGVITQSGASATVSLNASDYVELFTRQAQGAALNVNAGVGVTFLSLVGVARQ
jgi:hypothetical protein